MMTLSLGGVYFLMKNEKVKSFSLLTLSFLIKWVTGVLFLPFILFAFGKKIIKSDANFVGLCLLMSSLGLVYALTKYEMQPWYFLWVIPFIAIYKKNPFLTSLTIGLSIGLMLSYALFFYSGNWNPPIPTQKVQLIIISGAISTLLSYTINLIKRRISVNV
jgi:hypothetical protein